MGTMIKISSLKIELKTSLKNRLNETKTPARLTLQDILDSKETLMKKAAKLLGVKPEDISSLQILKHSIDARKKPQLFQVYTLGITLENHKLEEKTVKRCNNKQVTVQSQQPYTFPPSGKAKLPYRPVVIGTGPAGLFCGYMLAKHGYQPILLERGFDVETRSKDVEAYWHGGSLNPESNVQFGEGGAGTFSDGKLNTLVKDKYGRNGEVLRIFTEFGAPAHILYESKPHIGTDILKQVVVGMRNFIIENGGEVRFGAKVTGLLVDDGTLCGVEVNHCEQLQTTRAVLAIGHSARDTFTYLNALHVPMEAKLCSWNAGRAFTAQNQCLYVWRGTRRLAASGAVQADSADQHWARCLFILHVSGRFCRRCLERAGTDYRERHELCRQGRHSCKQRHYRTGNARRFRDRRTACRRRISAGTRENGIQAWKWQSSRAVLWRFCAKQTVPATD